MSHTPCSTGQRGGGVGILYKTCLEVRIPDSQQTTMQYNSFEHSQYLIKVNSKWLRIITVYRPPPSLVNGLTVQQFFSEFSTFLELLISLPGRIRISGDFNFHLDDTSNNHAREFLELLEVFSLTQHVNQPTHRLSHILDCIITEQDVDIVRDVFAHTPWISDHSLVSFNVLAPRPVLSHKCLITLNWKSLDVETFIENINNADFGNASNSVSECAYHYQTTLQSLIDDYVPSRKKTISLRPRAP